MVRLRAMDTALSQGRCTEEKATPGARAPGARVWLRPARMFLSIRTGLRLCMER